MSNLCCVLNPIIICEGCDQYWCVHCNAAWENANTEWTDPKRHPCQGQTWKCVASGTIVTYSEKWYEEEIIRLKVVNPATKR